MGWILSNQDKVLQREGSAAYRENNKSSVFLSNRDQGSKPGRVIPKFKQRLPQFV